MSAAETQLDSPEQQIEEVVRLWWVLLAGGLLSIVIGVLLLVWPSETLATVAVIVGVYLLLAGCVQLGLAFAEPSDSRAGALLRGAVAGIAGLIVIRHPGDSTLVVALAIGIVFVITGVMKLVAVSAAVSGRGWMLLGALTDLAIGVVLVAWPQFGVNSLAVLLGIVLLFRGLLECVAAFVLRSARS
jgi:uncharacterized membrane protein HdeD (DUF308 family)